MPIRYPVVQRGATLVELVVSIVVISVALAGVLLVMNRTTSSSADPMIRHQAVAIAEAYLEEILLKDFCDPATTCSAGSCNVCPANEGARNLYDNVCDYNNTNDSPPVRQDGTAYAALAGYGAQVLVTADGATLNGLSGDAANCQVLQIDVTVTGPGNTSYVLRGYRTNYQ